MSTTKALPIPLSRPFQAARACAARLASRPRRSETRNARKTGCFSNDQTELEKVKRWYPDRDSNPDALRPEILSLLRLPIPPSGLFRLSRPKLYRSRIPFPINLLRHDTDDILSSPLLSAKMLSLLTGAALGEPVQLTITLV